MAIIESIGQWIEELSPVEKKVFIAALLTLLLFSLPIWAQDQPDEDPIARHASIYPHPPKPQHLQPIQFDLGFTVETKHWYGKSREPLEGRIEIAQKRAKDGWYTNNFRDTDVNGRMVSQVSIDLTWRNPTVLMLVWKDKENHPMNGCTENGKPTQCSVTIEVSNEELLKGVKREITFHR